MYYTNLDKLKAPRAYQLQPQLTLLKENNNERGKNVLSCVYSRLAKTATDIASKTTSNVSNGGGGCLSNNTVVSPASPW